MPNYDEELSRVRRTVLTREDTRAEADLLFGDVAKKVRKADTEKMKRLFVQAAASQTMAPNLQGDTEKTASVAPAVDDFFEKVAAVDTRTEAQRRYPELLKVAAPRAGSFPTPTLTRKPAAPGIGETPVRSGLSGGSA